MLVLVDQDAVLADFDGGFDATWRESYPERPFVTAAERRHFYIRDDYPAEYGDDIRAIHTTEGFILGLSPMPGALEALADMLVAGHDVRICTSPLSAFRFCVVEKYQWVHDNLGTDWVGRLIITKDKTLVRGDVLIDDKPEVTGPSYQRGSTWSSTLPTTSARRAATSTGVTGEKSSATSKLAYGGAKGRSRFQAPTCRSRRRRVRRQRSSSERYGPSPRQPA